jgi:hypothetical protein
VLCNLPPNHRSAETHDSYDMTCREPLYTQQQACLYTNADDAMQVTLSKPNAHQLQRHSHCAQLLHAA